MKLKNPDVVGKELRDKRLQLGFTLDQMAYITNLHPITIMRLEQGKTAFVHARTAKALELMKAPLLTPKKVIQSGDLEAHKKIVVKKFNGEEDMSRDVLLSLRKQIDQYLAPGGVERRTGKDRRVTA